MATSHFIAAVLLSVVLQALAEPTRPSINHQTSTGMVAFINARTGNLDEQPFSIAVDPKEELYYSTQGMGDTALQVYIVDNRVTQITANGCYYVDIDTFPRPVEYYYPTSYLGEEAVVDVTTPFFSNMTCHRFQGTEDNGYVSPFDLYSNPLDEDFIVRKVYYRTARFPGSIIDTSTVVYDYHDPDYYQVPPGYDCQPAGNKKRSISRLDAERYLYVPFDFDLE